MGEVFCLNNGHKLLIQSNFEGQINYHLMPKAESAIAS